MNSRTVRPVRNRNPQPTQRRGRNPYAGGRSDARGREKQRIDWSKLLIKEEQYFDYELLLSVVFLMCFGLVMLYSASAYDNGMYLFVKQALIGVVSFVGMLAVSKLDYHIFGAYSYAIYVISIILMALVRFTPLGVEAKGAKRWLGIPGTDFQIQPSEIAKIAVILFISYEICRLGKKLNTKEGLIRVAGFGAIAAGSVFFLTDNLSTAIIVAGITFILIFVAHPKTKPFVKFMIGVLIVAGVVVLIAMATASEDSNFRIGRIVTWLDPEGSSSDEGYQVMQGLYAIGSGGFWGKGLGKSTQKLGVIPESQNDMILTIISEELGVFGVIVLLLLFGLLLYRLMFIAQNAPDLYGSLVATGIFAHIALQVVLNIAVVTNMIPTTGITLPFISYGGTSIVFLMAEMGIALGISRTIKLKEGTL